MPFWSSSTRRQLLLLGAAIAAAFSRAIVARGQSVPNASPFLFAQANDFVPVDGSPSRLQKDGKILTDTVLIVRNNATKQLVAVSPACTHRGCVVDWQQETQDFVCHCHGAKFGTDGRVLKGPARRPLQAFDVKLVKNRFFVKTR